MKAFYYYHSISEKLEVRINMTKKESKILCGLYCEKREILKDKINTYVSYTAIHVDIRNCVKDAFVQIPTIK